MYLHNSLSDRALVEICLPFFKRPGAWEGYHPDEKKEGRKELHGPVMRLAITAVLSRSWWKDKLRRLRNETR